MAKKHVAKQRVALVSPKGTRVTVGVEQAARMVTRGYAAAGGDFLPAEATPDAAPAEVQEVEDPKSKPEVDEASADVERPSRGASLAAWVAFADAVGFEYADGASRDEIRDAYEAAHPAE